jgi:hypothetical protein
MFIAETRSLPSEYAVNGENEGGRMEVFLMRYGFNFSVIFWVPTDDYLPSAQVQHKSQGCWAAEESTEGPATANTISYVLLLVCNAFIVADLVTRRESRATLSCSGKGLFLVESSCFLDLVGFSIY